MADLQEQHSWQRRLTAILSVVPEGELVLILRNLLAVWELVDQLRDCIGTHGMYEILDYPPHSTSRRNGRCSDYHPARGDPLLQDNVGAIHDHAWGDGELFAEYYCPPGIPVDFYEDGSTVDACAVCCSLPHKSPLLIPPALHQVPPHGPHVSRKGPLNARQSASRPTAARLDYCQYLLVSQINYTLTNFAEHTEQFSHAAANRYLAGDQVRPHLVWENIQSQVVQTATGCLVFDDTVVDKNCSHKIALVRRRRL